jgi:hypothetical protein
VIGDPVPNQLTFYDRGEDLSAAACHRFTGPAAPVSGAAVIDLTATVSYGGAGSIEIGRTTAIFTP